MGDHPGSTCSNEQRRRGRTRRGVGWSGGPYVLDAPGGRRCRRRHRGRRWGRRSYGRLLYISVLNTLLIFFFRLIVRIPSLFLKHIKWSGRSCRGYSGGKERTSSLTLCFWCIGRTKMRMEATTDRWPYDRLIYYRPLTIHNHSDHYSLENRFVRSVKWSFVIRI